MLSVGEYVNRTGERDPAWRDDILVARLELERASEPVLLIEDSMWYDVVQIAADLFDQVKMVRVGVELALF